MTPSAAAPPRDAGLDALRASAALGVMGFHVLAAGGGTLHPFDALFAHGFRGVVVFFVLSGYLVSRPFMVRRVAIPGYLLRRAARIMPAYLLALVGITLLTGDRLFPTHPLEYLTLTQNLDPELLLAGPLAPTWTLHLEAWFYLLLPLLMAGLLVVGAGRPMVGLALISLMATLSMMLHMGLGIAADPAAAQVGSLSLPAMLWAFLPGIAVAWLVTRWTAAAAGRRAPVAALGLVLIAVGWLGSLASPLGLALQDAALAIGTATLVLVSSGSPGLVDRWPRIGTAVAAPAIAGLAWFGRSVSYPFYLWHVPVLGLAVAAGITGWAAFGVVLVVAGAIGYVSWRLVEAPAMRAAGRWSGRDAASPGDARHDARVTAAAGVGAGVRPSSG